MIDFLAVAANALWILGLAVLLAVWSYAYYEAKLARSSVSDLLAGSNYDVTLALGLVMMCLGLAATDDRWWLRLLWLALGVAMVAQLAVKRRNRS